MFNSQVKDLLALVACNVIQWLWKVRGHTLYNAYWRPVLGNILVHNSIQLVPYGMQIPLPEQLILIDIETVSQYPVFGEMPEEWQQLWTEKTKWQWQPEDDAASFYQQRAAILSEFGKIVCISVGYFRQEGEALQLRLKSFANTSEKDLLQSFVQALSQLIQAKKIRMWFGGHNIREFDIPYLCRRLFINEMQLPAWLDFQSLKPWEAPVIDTLQLWRFGDHKNYTSLSLLAAALGIASPKDDLDGSMVGTVYWQENDLDRIAIYCQKDVATVAQLLLRLAGKPMLQQHQIVSA
jgi:hypothetical protein